MSAVPDPSSGLPFGTFAPGYLTRLVLFLSQHTPLGRGKARKLMAACVRHLNEEKLDANLFGQNVRLHLKNNSSEIKALMKPGKYSRTEFDFARAYLPDQDSVFVDIGANAGLFSLGVSQGMQSGILIAFEPQAELFARLKNNLVSLNPDLANRLQIYLFQTALGRCEGELSLSVPAQLGQASARPLAGTRTLSVSVRPLLACVEEVGAAHIDILKIDVEGFEDEVLLPFLTQAPKAIWPKGIILEHCHRDRWEEDCEAALLKAGYELSRRDRTNLMFVRGAL